MEAYLDSHNIRTVLNEVVTDVLRAKPEDPFAYLAELLKARRVVAPKIAEVVGRQVLDSRGNPTVEADILLAPTGPNDKPELAGRSAAPSGASTGSNEALELRDKDSLQVSSVRGCCYCKSSLTRPNVFASKTKYVFNAYLGKGVLKAVSNIKTFLSPALVGADPTNQRDCDDRVCKADGTELKTKVGGNAVTAVSFAIAEAGSNYAKVSPFIHFAKAFHGDKLPEKFTLPVPLVNILNGGKHAGGKLKIQEFMIMPRGDITFRERLRVVTTVYHHLGKLLVAKYGKSAKNLGDEGGFAPQLNTPDEALSVIEEAIESAGFKPNSDVFLALDCAASEFYDKDTQKYEIEEGKFLTSAETVEYYGALIERHPALISIEDALDEKDYEGWKLFTERFGSKAMIVGDDLFTTNTNLIRRGLEEKWANSLLLKVNQIGTISEAMDAAKMLYDAEGKVIVSHRSGETVSPLISDLAVGIGAGYIKTGAPARGERVAKYNRLLQIEEELEQMNALSLE